VLQDRLIAEMELRDIKDREAGNRFLAEQFIDEYNCRFARVPEGAHGAWRRIPRDVDLERSISFRYQAVVGNDNAIRLARHVSGTESYMGYYPMTASNDYSLIVTRDSSGEFNVWIDGTLRITATNTAVTTSVYFLVVIIDPGNYIDNIQVYDEILTVSGGNGGDGNGGGLVFPPELIAIIGGAVAIIVIIAVVILILRRRKAGL